MKEGHKQQLDIHFLMLTLIALLISLTAFTLDNENGSEQEAFSMDSDDPQLILNSLIRYDERNASQDPVVEYFAADRKTIEITAYDLYVNLQLSELHPSKKKDLIYEYQLKGYHDRWIRLSDNKEISFTKLDPGSYELKVRLQEAEGQFKPALSGIAIEVQPPWYAGRSMLLLYCFLFLASLILLSRYFAYHKLEIQDTKRLKELDDFKNRLYANITHEFRTPLTIIMGVAQQLREGKSPDKETQQKIALIQRNGDNLLGLINQVLDLSKVENKVLEVNYVQNDAVRYVRYLTESFHSLANGRNILLQVETGEPKIQMDYDPEKLRQILSNLLSNAIKFTSSGGRVTVFVGREQDQFQIKVSDTGSGISKEDLPQVFHRFYRVKEQRNQVAGVGIGLALTKELVNLLGGRIEVSSELGQGTTFTVYLPIQLKATKTAVSYQHTWEDPSTNTMVKGPARPIDREANRPRLLIIEDNPDLIDYLASCLRNEFELSFAYNGEAGIKLALETIPDIIISDVMMPGKDGFELCETLKNQELTSHIPIILLTARADMESRLAGLACGADVYLKKPFHEKELYVILQNLLSLRKKLQSRYETASRALDKSENGDLLGKDQLPEPVVEDVLLRKIRELVEEELSDCSFGLPQLCRKLGMSRSQIYRKVKALTGQSPSRFIRSVRLSHAQRLLSNVDLNISEIAYEVGFSSPVYFSDVFFEEFGCRPSEARKEMHARTVLTS